MTDPAPQMPTVRRKRGALVAGVLILVVVFALAAGGFYVVRAGALTFYGMRYVAGPFSDRSLYEIGIQGAHKVVLPVPGNIIGYAREGGKEAAIALSLGNEDIYVHSGSVWKPLTKNGGIKAALQISPDGTMLAYAFRSETASTTDFYAQDAWSIHVMDTSSGADRVVGAGYGPQFFSRDGVKYLLYTGVNKVTIVDLDKNTHQDIDVNTGVKNGFFSALVSPNGAYLALPSITENYAVFALSATNGLFTIAKPIGTTPRGSVFAAFDGNALLTVANDKSSTLLRQMNPADPSVITKARALPLNQVVGLAP